LLTLCDGFHVVHFKQFPEQTIDHKVQRTEEIRLIERTCFKTYNTVPVCVILHVGKAYSPTMGKA